MPRHTGILTSIPQPTNVTEYKKQIHTTRELTNPPHNKILDIPPSNIRAQKQLFMWETHDFIAATTNQHHINISYTDLCPFCHAIPHFIEDCPSLAALRKQHNISMSNGFGWIQLVWCPCAVWLPEMTEPWGTATTTRTSIDHKAIFKWSRLPCTL